MTDLEDTFVELGISQYLEVFIEHGFDTWDAVVDITESDFDILGVKLGHRRKLQRKIANIQGYSSGGALISPTSKLSAQNKLHFDEIEATSSKTDLKDGINPQTGKRKYRRHPKPDENAPERPPSAYVIFSNKMRDDLKGKNLSFTEIAKLVGENWQNLSASEKEPYESQASKAKDRFSAELGEYKKTENYRLYVGYLMEFKEKQARLQHAAKRPKLENKVSTTGSAASSTTSHHGGDILTDHSRVGTIAPTSASWFTSGSSTSPTQAAHPTAHANHSAPGSSNGQGSANMPQSAALPGYRDALFGAMQQTLAWRDNTRESDVALTQQLPRLAGMGERRSGQPPSESPREFQTTSQNGNYRPMGQNQNQSQGFTPPLIAPESVPGTTKSGSSASSSQSPYYGPRTPMDVTLERSLPIPQTYPAKSFENQLPPLRSSMSPRASSNYNSPPSIPPMDYPLGNGTRAYVSMSSQPPSLPGVAADTGNRSRVQAHNILDESLDPVSALLRAGEIVNRNSNNEHGGR